MARLDSSRYRVVMLGVGPADVRIANRENTEVIPWGKHANTARVLMQLLWRAPDVYFFPREGLLDAAFMDLRAKLRLRCALVTYVVSGALDESQKKNRPLLWRAMRDCDALAANSRHMAETVRKLGGRNVYIVYDGIDRRYYYPNLEAASGEGKAVLFAGSFRTYKRADLFVAQAARFPQWAFRLAGAGEEEPACRKLAEETNCKNVEFLGPLSGGQLGEEMRRAEIFFHPSEIEGHPQVLGQAAACGLPCIARSSYNPDYVVHGVTGLLASSDSELGAALGRLIEDSNLRKKMSAAAIRHAQKFEWDDVTQQWAGIMEDAVVHRQNQRRNRSS